MQRDNIDSALHKGTLLSQASNHTEALAHYLRYADADASGKCLLNASLAAFKIGDVAQCRDLAERTVKKFPSMTAAYINLSAALATLGNLTEAVDVCDAGLSLEKNSVELWANRGGAQTKLGLYKDGNYSLDRALALNPNHEFSLLNKGTALRGLLQFDEAERCYLRAHELNKANSDPLWNLAILYLQHGDFEKGLPLYEARWSTSTKHSDRFRSPKPWVDPAKHYDSILIWPEQGVGDEVMFASHFEFLHLLSRQVTIIADQRLLPMFKRSFPTFNFLPRTGYIDHDSYQAHLPIGSLPLLRHQLGVSQSWFGKSFLIPAFSKPTPAPALLTGHHAKRRIGISWRSKNDATNSNRTISIENMLQCLEPSRDMAVNLQYGDCTTEFEASCRKLGLTYDSTTNIDKFNDLEGMTSLIASCNQVLTIDNSTAHLAGALGVSTIVLLSICPDWRWGLNTNCSPWYQSIRLVRQAEPMHWETPLEEAKQLLKL